MSFKGKNLCLFANGQANITGIFGWKNPGKKLANFVIIKYSFTFWAGSAALEVYMSKLEVLTFSIVVFLFNKIFEKVVLEFSILLDNDKYIYF